MSGEIETGAALPLTARSALHSMADGIISAEIIAHRMIEKIQSTDGEGSRAYLSLDVEAAAKAAQAADQARAAGHSGPLAGLPVAIKDLFDIKGQVTTAGSLVLAGAEPAHKDAAMVERLRSAGAVILGRSHMNEFAYSALGTNPHFPQPRSPWDRERDDGRGRSPGGSTSGGAVAVADGLAYAALGSDTGGSTRIPAAFCGMTGWRPSQNRMSGQGAFPLAASFDTPGLIARCVDDCQLFDSILTGDNEQHPVPPVTSLRLCRADGMPFDDLEAEVEGATRKALNILIAAGARIDACSKFDWAAPATALRAGQITAVEGLVAHGKLIDRWREYDPRVVARMRGGEEVKAKDYVAALRNIEILKEEFDHVFKGFDAILMPTVAIVPPRLAELDEDDAFFAINTKALRNTLIASILDLPAISIPIHAQNEAPVGLMLIGRRGCDTKLLVIAKVIESTLRTHVSTG